MIVPAAIADLPRMAAMAQEFYASSRWLREFKLNRFVDLWTGLLQNGGGAIFLMLDGDKIVGTIGGVLYPEAYSGEQIAQEFFWFVHAEHRGRGHLLYRRFEDWARSKDCQEIRMGHLADLMPEKVAVFYRRLGFVKIETNYAKRLVAAECRKVG